MTLSYAEALEALHSRGRFGVRLGLARTRALLRAMDNPERSFRGALVAGTNGKGSVIALAAAALREAAVHVASTPKPHLVSYRERAVLDGRPIDAPTFTRLVAELLPIADRVARRAGDPTEFELLTAVIFRWFAEVRPDVALVEVGLGGRLDATHAWDGGVAVVTNVTLDHMDRLGPTVTAIAKEKAAIIVRGDRAVTGATGDALRVVRRRARSVGAPLVEVGPAPLLGWDRDAIEVLLPQLGVVRVGLRGRHQAANVAVADALLDALAEVGIASTPPDARRRGYEGAVWPGRLELLEVEGRHVLLDGAHNEAGATVLGQALDDLRPWLQGGETDARRRIPAATAEADPDAGIATGGVSPVPLTLVMAVMADKDVEAVINALLRSGSMAGARIICSQLEVPRALPADALAARWRTLDAGREITVAPTVQAALADALSGPGSVVVAGSLYLVGAVRGLLVEDPLLVDSGDEVRR